MVEGVPPLMLSLSPGFQMGRPEVSLSLRIAATVVSRNMKRAPRAR